MHIFLLPWWSKCKRIGCFPTTLETRLSLVYTTLTVAEELPWGWSVFLWLDHCENAYLLQDFLLDCNHGYLHAVTEFTLPSASMKTLFFNPFFIGDKLQATCKLNKANLNLISPQDLNKFMCGTVYLVGCQLTLADIMLYYALHPVMMELSVQEREQLVNLSRWFNQVNFSITRI